jgi:hypothetical protein
MDEQKIREAFEAWCRNEHPHKEFLLPDTDVFTALSTTWAAFQAGAAALSQPAAADEVKAELVVAAKRALNVLKSMGNTPNPKNALGALEAAIAKATK